MKILAAVVSLALFFASFPLFAYAFWVPEQWAALVFFMGIMSVTLSTDHRAVDGALGAELIGAFKRHIENPIGMLV